MSEGLQKKSSSWKLAIACGGTGGHLFPGLAIADCLHEANHQPTLILSEKPIDRLASEDSSYPKVFLKSLGWQSGQRLRFLAFFPLRFLDCLKWMFKYRPDAVLAMGGFTSLAPTLAALLLRRPIFYHESNTIPGKAVRWLAKVASLGFVGFESAKALLSPARVVLTGTPVRREFRSLERSFCCSELGLDPEKPILLITGGSQGALGLNRKMMQALPWLHQSLPQCQVIHLCGMQEDLSSLRNAYSQAAIKALVLPFMERMELALGAATMAIARSGASFISEMAAAGCPSLLIPYPHSADEHQRVNARTLADANAALFMDEKEMTPQRLIAAIERLSADIPFREKIQENLQTFDAPDAAARISEQMVHYLNCGGFLGQDASASTLSAPSGAKPASSMLNPERSMTMMP
ncbi:MAG TPA: hypothetical protein DEP78_14095 [Verrucomicrobiales bacterium]|nr:hypothetical protein [Verrucomicrobiales bacterium]